MSSELKVSFSNRSTLTTIDFWPSNKLDQFYPNIFSRFGTHFWIGSGIYLEQGKPMSYILLYLPTYLPTYLPRVRYDVKWSLHPNAFKIIPFVFQNGPTPAPSLFIFGLFKQTIQFLQQINVKKPSI